MDTSVFVAAASSSTGASRGVLRRCLVGRHEPLMGQALFAEYESVLARRELFQRSPISEDEREVLWSGR